MRWFLNEISEWNFLCRNEFVFLTLFMITGCCLPLFCYFSISMLSPHWVEGMGDFSELFRNYKRRKENVVAMLWKIHFSTFFFKKWSIILLINPTRWEKRPLTSPKLFFYVIFSPELPITHFFRRIYSQEISEKIKLLPLKYRDAYMCMHVHICVCIRSVLYAMYKPCTAHT